MKALRIFFLLCVFGACAQQTMMFTQYTFNKAGANPAASGTEIDQTYYYAFGGARQWVSLDNAPQQNFLNFSYTIRPPRSYRFWQNAGVYLENDNSALVGYDGFYGTYTVHFLMHKKMVLSFGVMAGMRKFSKSIGLFDPNDPAIRRSVNELYLYPDIIPGVRLSDKRFFLDVSARQITITNLKDFKGRRIGGPSLLLPTLYVDYGRKVSLNDLVLMMPSVAVNLPILSPPVVDANLMFYYANRVGLGVGVRNLSFVNGTVQLRFLKGLTAGFSYAYPINAVRYVAQNSFEVMVGMVPMGMAAKVSGKHSVAKCPGLSY